MGASSSLPSGQVAFVALPNGGVGAFTQLALVPFTKRYFPSPASLAQLHALYCSDRVRASFRSGIPRLSAQAYYDMIVVGDAVHQKRAARGQDPCPIAVCVWGKTSEGWSQIGYFSCRKYDENGDDCEETMLGMFKVYSGARASAESDVALVIIRAATLVYRIGAMNPDGTIPWPRETNVQFNTDNSGTAGILSRLFRYVALHSRHDADIRFVVSDVVSESGVPQYKVRCDDANGLELLMETLSNDATMRAARHPSLRNQDMGSLWAALGCDERKMEDEPCTVIVVRQLTNDSNFPSPANRENPCVMKAAAAVKTLHDECKARSRAPRLTDASSDADHRVADLLANTVNLAPVPDNDVMLAAEVLDFQILMAIPSNQMHTPVVAKHKYAVEIATRFFENPLFSDVFSQFEDGPARLEVVREACRKSPWRVVATFSAFKGGCGGKCIEALHDVVADVMYNGNTAQGPPATTNQPINLVDRLIDVKLRGLISMNFQRASTLLFALLPVEREDPHLVDASQAFQIIDDTTLVALP